MYSVAQRVGAVVLTTWIVVIVLATGALAETIQSAAQASAAPDARAAAAANSEAEPSRRESQQPEAASEDDAPHAEATDPAPEEEAADDEPEDLEGPEEAVDEQSEEAPAQDGDGQPGAGQDDGDAADPKAELTDISDYPIPLAGVQPSVTVRLGGDSDNLRIGDELVLYAELSGFEGLRTSIRWQAGQDGQWKDLRGENKTRLTIVITQDNADCAYRVAVDVHPDT